MNGLGTDVVTSTSKVYGGDVPGYDALFVSGEPNAFQARQLFIAHLQFAFPRDSHQSSRDALRLLDAGCGTGRDLDAFDRMGYHAEGFDSAAEFVNAAKAKSGCIVHLADFENLCLHKRFHGIFCLASLYHVPRARLVAALQNLCDHLEPGGVILLTIPGGPPYMDRLEDDGRWVNFMPPADVAAHVQMAGLRIVEFSPEFKIYSGRSTLIVACRE